MTDKLEDVEQMFADFQERHDGKHNDHVGNNNKNTF